jgi:biopolymer transport protein ExbD
MSISKRDTKEEPKIDMTPMLDVVFILLIFFIVASTFIDETAIDVKRPLISEEPPKRENRNIFIEVGPNGSIWLEERNIDVRSVRANIERLRAESPKTKVVISADPKSKTEIYIKIADQAREAGVYDISLATPNNR